MIIARLLFPSLGRSTAAKSTREQEPTPSSNQAGQETEPHEILYFKVYKSQLAVIERAFETAGLMLGTDKSRGYCLELICADFLAGVNIEDSNPEALVLSLRRVYELLPHEQQSRFLCEVTSTGCED